MILFQATRILQSKDRWIIAQDSTPSHDAPPAKSEEFLRFENLARKMFATPKIVAETPKKASNDPKGLQAKMQGE